MPKRQKDGGARATSHTPVLLEEVIAGLALQPGATVIDATLGNGGHFFAIAERLGPKGTLLGVDVDVAAVESVRARLALRAARRKSSSRRVISATVRVSPQSTESRARTPSLRTLAGARSKCSEVRLRAAARVFRLPLTSRS